MKKVIRDIEEIETNFKQYRILAILGIMLYMISLVLNILLVPYFIIDFNSTLFLIFTLFITMIGFNGMLLARINKLELEFKED